MVPASSFSTGGDAQATGGGNTVAPVGRKTPRKLYGARARQKTPHIDPEKAPHAAILAKKHINQLQMVPEHRIWPYAELGGRGDQNKVVPPFDFRARVVSAGDPPGAHAATLVKTDSGLLADPSPIHNQFEDITRVPAKNLGQQALGTTPNSRRLTSQVSSTSQFDDDLPDKLIDASTATTKIGLPPAKTVSEDLQHEYEQLLKGNLPRDCPQTHPVPADSSCRPHLGHSISLGEYDADRDGGAQYNSKNCSRCFALTSFCVLATGNEQRESLP